MSSVAPAQGDGGAAQLPAPAPALFYDSARIESETVRLRQFYQEHAPGKVSVAEKNVLKYAAEANGFEKMWTALEKIYKKPKEQPGDNGGGSKEAAATASHSSTALPPPSTPPQLPLAPSSKSRGAAASDPSQRLRLERFFLKYAPERIAEVDKQLSKYAKSSGGFEAMWTSLEKKYGPEPPAPSSSVELVASLAVAHAQPNSSNGLKYSDAEVALWKARLQKFYQFYAPEKTDADIDAALAKYSPPDGFERMLAQLMEKYGAEPIQPATGLMKRYLPEEAQQSQTEQPKAPTAPRKADDELSDVISDLSPLSAASPPSGKEGSRERDNDALDRPLGSFCPVVVLHALIRMQGCSVLLYENAVPDRQAAFRRAVEYEISVNLGIDIQQIHVTKVSPGIVIEMDLELSQEQVHRAVGEELVTKILLGTFTVPNIRDSYKRDLGGNPLQLHTEGAAIFGGACTPLFNSAPSAVAAEERQAQVSGGPAAIGIESWPPKKYSIS